MNARTRAIDESVRLMRQAAQKLRDGGLDEIANELDRVAAKARRETNHMKAVEHHPDLFR
jgi:NADH:ubiquinone oxidoreductase subunit D